MTWPVATQPSSTLRWVIRDQMRAWAAQIRREGWPPRDIEAFIDDVLYEVRNQVACELLGAKAAEYLEQWPGLGVGLPSPPPPAQVQAGRFIEE